MVWGQGTLIFKTSSGDPKIEDRRVDAGPSGAAVVVGALVLRLMVPTGDGGPEGSCPRSLGAEVKERGKEGKAEEGGGTAESRIHWVQHAPGQHLEGSFLSCCHFLPHPGVPPPLPGGVALCWMGPRARAAPHRPAGSD